MDIDWIVGIFVFIFFVIWAFSFYTALFREGDSQFGVLADVEREKIMGYTEVDVYEAPVRYVSPGDVTDGIFRAGSVWYSGERNSTRVFSGNDQLPCRISGDELFWQANVTSGTNVFTIRTAEVNSTMNCSGTFSISSYNTTVPWVFEEMSMISLQRLGEMENMSYEDFRSLAGLNEDFSMSVVSPSLGLELGRSIPYGPVDVNSREYRRTVYENSEVANVTISIW